MIAPNSLEIMVLFDIISSPAIFAVWLKPYFIRSGKAAAIKSIGCIYGYYTATKSKLQHMFLIAVKSNSYKNTFCVM